MSVTGQAKLREGCGFADEFVSRLPADWVDELALAGDPDRIRGNFADLHRAGADTVVTVPATSDPLEESPGLARSLR